MYFSLAITQGFAIKGRVLTSLALMLKRKVGRIFVYDLYLLQDAILHEVRSAALLWGCTLHKPWSLGEGASKFLDAQRRRPGAWGPVLPAPAVRHG